MVQGLDPQNIWSNINPTIVPITEQLPTYDIGPQDYSRARTPEEEANVFSEPFLWNQGETTPAHGYTYYSPSNFMRNPIAENSYRNSLENKVGISYSAYSGNPIEQNTIQMDEKFTPDYFAPFTETGKPLTCTGGKIAYKGQCITEEAYVIIRQRETDAEDFTYQREQEERKKKFELTINEIIRDTEEGEARYTDRRIRDYFTNYKKSRKPDKIDALETLSTSILSNKIPKIDANGNEVLDKTGKPVMETIEENLKRTYFINKNENGLAQLYPLDIMHDRIMQSGFFNNEFETYWGLDPKQVKAQVGEVQKQAKAVYDNRVTNRIMDDALKNGIAPYDAAAKLSKRWGYTSNFRKQHVPIVNKQIDDLYADFVEKSLSSLQKEMGVYVNEYGITTHDTKKANDKQNVNFDFRGDHTKSVFDETGVLVSQEFDPVGQYARAWINSAPTQKEKTERQNKVNAIKNKNYTAVGKKAYDESLNAPLSGYLGDPFNGMTHQQVTNNYGDRMQDIVRTKNTQFNNLAIGRAIDAKNEAIYTTRETDLAAATGFDKDFATYMSNAKRAAIYDTYKEALNNKKIDYSIKAKIINAIDKGNIDYVTGLLLGATDYSLKDINVLGFGPTFADRLDKTLGFETYYDDLFTPSGMGEGLSFKAKTTPMANKKEIGLGTKIWDVLTNLPHASYYFMNMKGDNMWGFDPTRSYNDRSEYERKFHQGQGTRSSISTGASFGPLEFLNVFNSLNPLNYLDDIYRGYEANGITGASARMNQKNWEGLEAASMFVPGGGAFKLGRQAVALRNAAAALKAAKNVGNLGVRAGNLGLRTGNTLRRGLNYMGRNTGYPGQYVSNYFTKAGLPFTLDAIRPGGYLQTGYGDLNKGNYWDAAENLGFGSLGISPLVRKGIQTLKTGVYRLNTGVDLTPSLRNINPEGTTFATNTEQFRQLTGLDKSYYRSLMKQVHPDVQGGSNESSKLLTDLYYDKGFQNIPFNASMQTGILTPKYKFGPFSAGQNVFQPKTLEELLQIPEQIPKAARTFRGGRIRLHQTGGVIDSLKQLGKYQKGGALPKFQYRGAVQLYEGVKNLIKPIESVNKVFGNIHKINPWRFKANPEAYYHRSPNLENIINRETGTLQGFGNSLAGIEFSKDAGPGGTGGLGIRGDGSVSTLNLKKPANSQLYFAKGVPLDGGRYNRVLDKKTGKLIDGQKYEGPYMVEVEGVPMGLSTKGRKPGAEPLGIGSYAVSKRPISLDEAKFYKEHWWYGYKQILKELPGSPNASSLVEPFEIAKTKIINSSNNFNRIIRKPDPVINSNYGQLEFAFPEEPVGLSAKLMNEQKIMEGMERAHAASEERSLAIEQANAIKSSTEIPKIYPIGNPDYYIDLLNMTPMSLANREFYKSIIQSIKNQNNVASEKQKDILDRIKTGNFKYNQGGSLNNFKKGGAIKINLSKKEIEEYIKNGYVIEEQ